MAYLKPEGVFPAMLTPFDDNGKINEKMVRSIIEFGLDRGLHGLFPVSSVGEFIHMTPEECKRMMKITVDAAAGRAPVFAGVSSSCTDMTLDFARYAQDIGCNGIVCCPPIYYTATQPIIEKHYEILADTVEIPVLLYNIPLFATPISYDVVKRLSARPNIVGMKDSSGNMVDFMHFMDKIRLTGSNFSFMMGREELLYLALMAGASGCMVCSAGIFPEVMVEIYKATNAGDIERAKKIQISLCAIVRLMFSPPFPAGFKTAMEIRGFKMGPPKRLLADSDVYMVQGIRSRLERIMGDLLNECGSKVNAQHLYRT